MSTILSNYFNQTQQTVKEIADAVECFGEERYKKEQELQSIPYCEWKEERESAIAQKIRDSIKALQNNRQQINDVLKKEAIVLLDGAVCPDVNLFNIPGLQLTADDLNAILQRNPHSEVIRRCVQSYIDQHPELKLQRHVTVKTIQSKIATVDALFYDLESIVGNCDIRKETEPQYFACSLKNLRDNWDAFCKEKIEYVTTW